MLRGITFSENSANVQNELSHGRTSQFFGVFIIDLEQVFGPRDAFVIILHSTLATTM